jgi:hypothetical protein
MAALVCCGVLTILASLALGSAILATAGVEFAPPLAGGLGFSVLVVVATVLVRLPGNGVTALCGVGALCAAAVWRLVAGHDRRAGWGGPAAGVAAAAGVVAATFALLLLPFLAAGHYGPLGVGVDDDLGLHLGTVYALAHDPAISLLKINYPLGNESLAAALTILGFGDEPALLGVAGGVIALTCLSALALLAELPRPLRIAAAIACGLPFLSAAYFGEGSFKEPTMALLVLECALLTHGQAGRRLSGRRQAVLLAPVALATLFILGPAGLIWPAAFVCSSQFARRWRPPRARRAWLRQAAIALGAVAGAAAVAAAIDAIGRHIGARGFHIYLDGLPAGKFGGNFARQLPLTEGLGVWRGHDFRVGAPPGLVPPLLVAVAVVSLIASLATQLPRWRTNLTLPLLVSVAIYLAARETTVPYFSAMLLVSLEPLLLVYVMLGVAAWIDRLDLARVCAPALIAALVLAVLVSDAGGLAASPVDDPALSQELASLRPLLHEHPVLLLADVSWGPEALRGSQVLTIVGDRGLVRAGKSVQPPFDFDSPTPRLLGELRYAIVSRTLYASAPPANWQLLHETAHFELFVRRGPPTPRQTLRERSAPGAVLRCRTPAGRALAARTGVAAVRQAPIAATAWRAPSGRLLPVNDSGASMPAGAQAVATLRLPRGSFELSLGYQSAVPAQLRIGSDVTQIGATLELLGPVWRVATVTSSGALITLRLTTGSGHQPAAFEGALVTIVEAVASDTLDVLIPLRRACGRYVDWYRLG